MRCPTFAFLAQSIGHATQAQENARHIVTVLACKKRECANCSRSIDLPNKLMMLVTNDSHPRP